jgi:solute carrier family 29 (equilibrative nucleoside transporter), member 1/2/3
VDVASSGGGGVAAFVAICLIAGGLGVADGHVQGGLTGDLSLMCPEFLQVPFFKKKCFPNKKLFWLLLA